MHHFFMDRPREVVHYSVFNKNNFVYIAIINSSSGHLFTMCDHCCYILACIANVVNLDLGLAPLFG